MFNLGSNREVCWDKHIVDTMENACVRMHKAEKKNVVMECDEPWEELRAGYLSVLKLGDTYRLYYRTSGSRDEKKECFCVAESKDGKTFRRLDLGMHEMCGTKHNNVIFVDRERFVDNFSIHVDTNPACPADEKFKALSLSIRKIDGKYYLDLLYYKSADGIKFEKVGFLDIPGIFDTHNVVLWDENEQEYKMYIRDFHDYDGSRSNYYPRDEIMEPCYRDVCLTRSKDFVHWTKPEQIKYSDGDIHIQMYTNQVIKYPRANIFFGMPTRYVNRVKDTANFKYLPQWYGKRAEYIKEGQRQGTVATDCVLMTSRDGETFDRYPEAFAAPGIEKMRNWQYGEGYFGHGLVETECDENELVNEYSFYESVGRWGELSKIVRHTMRIDGFFSWFANYYGGTVMTKPVVFDGNDLEINFATSSLGYVRIVICDENGNELEGYDSGRLFGNSLSRPVDFEGSLEDLSGKPVRIKFELKDADLYSFKFNKRAAEAENGEASAESAEGDAASKLRDDELTSFKFIAK